MTVPVGPVPPPTAAGEDRAAGTFWTPDERGMKAILWPMTGCLMAVATLLADLIFDLEVALVFAAVATMLLIFGGLSIYHYLRELDDHRRALAEARDQANEASQAKSQFLAVMSHELRTPMSGMIGTLDLLRETSLTPGQRRLTETLAASSSALLAVLNDILDYSKIEAGMLHMEEADFRLRDVIDSTIELFRAQAEHKSLRIAAQLGADVPPILKGDATRLRQILTNLIGNAVKFTDMGRVDVRVLKIGDSPLCLRFEVQDTGIGISTEKQAVLFQPFVQGDARTSRRFGGTGLGLAICSRLAAAMGGRIGLTSAIGLGSCFWFTIAALAGSEEGLAEVPPEFEPPRRRARTAPVTDPSAGRLLVAEDNDVNRFLIEEHLRRRGYAVTMVENGWAAVEAHRAQPFDVVLLDMRMPVMDGPTATVRIRALPPPACSVPIIALTADAMREDAQRYLRSGIDALHTKPIDWDGLDLTIRRFLEERGSRPKAPIMPPRAAAAPLDPHIDTQTVSRLREVMGDEAMSDLLAAFRTTLANEGAKLHAAADANAPREVREAAHAIQGMSAELGAHGIANLVRTIRIDGDHALDLPAAQALLVKYDAMVDETLARLETLIDQPTTH